ncbi:MAG: hypothetical protein ACK55I_51135, partial [bacterium]
MERRKTNERNGNTRHDIRCHRSKSRLAATVNREKNLQRNAPHPLDVLRTQTKRAVLSDYEINHLR